MATDQELRSNLLRDLYSKRSEPWVSIGMNSRYDPGSQELIRIAQQLSQCGLIEFKMLNRSVGGMARLTAAGVNVVEGTVPSPTAVTIDRRQTINVHESSGIQIGDGNSLTIQQSIDQLVSSIDQSTGSPEEKAEAKSLLSRFLAHPLVTSIVGGAVGIAG